MRGKMERKKAEFYLSDAPALIVVFLIYTNLAVLLPKFHGLPSAFTMLVPAALALPLFYQLVICHRPLILPRAFPWVALFMIVLMISTIFARNFGEAFEELTIYFTEGLYLYVVLTNIIRTPKQLRRVIWALLAAAIVMGAAPAYQQITGTFDNNYGGLAQISEATFRTGEVSLQGDVRQPRLAGSIGEMNRFAQGTLMLVPLGMLRFWGESSRFLKLLALIAAGLAGLGMALAFSRGAAVAFALMVVLMVFMRLIKPAQLIGFIFVGVLVLLAFPQYTQRLVSIQSVASLFGAETQGGEESSPDGAIRGRITEMLAAARVYGDHPIIGVGPGMFKYYSRQYSLDIGLRNLMGNRRAHSLYLGIAAETGTIGIIAFLAMLGVTIYDLLRVRSISRGRRPDLENFANSFVLVLLAYLTTGIFLHLSYMRYFWMMFAIASAAATITHRELGKPAVEEVEAERVPLLNRGIV